MGNATSAYSADASAAALEIDAANAKAGAILEIDTASITGVIEIGDGVASTDGAVPINGAASTDGAVPINGASSTDGAVTMNGAASRDGAVPINGAASTDGAAPPSPTPPSKDVKFIDESDREDEEATKREEEVKEEEKVKEQKGMEEEKEEKAAVAVVVDEGVNEVVELLGPEEFEKAKFYVELNAAAGEAGEAATEKTVDEAVKVATGGEAAAAEATAQASSNADVTGAETPVATTDAELTEDEDAKTSKKDKKAGVKKSHVKLPKSIRSVKKSISKTFNKRNNTELETEAHAEKVSSVIDESAECPAENPAESPAECHAKLPNDVDATADCPDVSVVAKSIEVENVDATTETSKDDDTAATKLESSESLEVLELEITGETDIPAVNIEKIVAMQNDGTAEVAIKIDIVNVDKFQSNDATTESLNQANDDEELTGQCEESADNKGETCETKAVENDLNLEIEADITQSKTKTSKDKHLPVALKTIRNGFSKLRSRSHSLKPSLEAAAPLDEKNTEFLECDNSTTLLSYKKNVNDNVTSESIESANCIEGSNIIESEAEYERKEGQVSLHEVVDNSDDNKQVKCMADDEDLFKDVVGTTIEDVIVDENVSKDGDKNNAGLKKGFGSASKQFSKSFRKSFKNSEKTKSAEEVTESNTSCDVEHNQVQGITAEITSDNENIKKHPQQVTEETQQNMLENCNSNINECDKLSNREQNNVEQIENSESQKTNSDVEVQLHEKVKVSKRSKSFTKTIQSAKNRISKSVFRANDPSKEKTKEISDEEVSKEIIDINAGPFEGNEKTEVADIDDEVGNDYDTPIPTQPFEDEGEVLVVQKCENPEISESCTSDQEVKPGKKNFTKTIMSAKKRFSKSFQKATDCNNADIVEVSAEVHAMCTDEEVKVTKTNKQMDAVLVKVDFETEEVEAIVEEANDEDGPLPSELDDGQGPADECGISKNLETVDSADEVLPSTKKESFKRSNSIRRSIKFAKKRISQSFRSATNTGVNESVASDTNSTLDQSATNDTETTSQEMEALTSSNEVIQLENPTEVTINTKVMVDVVTEVSVIASETSVNLVLNNPGCESQLKECSKQSNESNSEEGIEEMIIATVQSAVEAAIADAMEESKQGETEEETGAPPIESREENVVENETEEKLQQQSSEIESCDPVEPRSNSSHFNEKFHKKLMATKKKLTKSIPKKQKQAPPVASSTTEQEIESESAENRTELIKVSEDDEVINLGTSTSISKDEKSSKGSGMKRVKKSLQNASNRLSNSFPKKTKAPKHVALTNLENEESSDCMTTSDAENSSSCEDGLNLSPAEDQSSLSMKGKDLLQENLSVCDNDTYTTDNNNSLEPAEADIMVEAFDVTDININLESNEATESTLDSKPVFITTGPVLKKMNEVETNYTAKMPKIEDTFCVRINTVEDETTTGEVSNSGEADVHIDVVEEIVEVVAAVINDQNVADVAADEDNNEVVAAVKDDENVADVAADEDVNEIVADVTNDENVADVAADEENNEVVAAVEDNEIVADVAADEDNKEVVAAVNDDENVADVAAAEDNNNVAAAVNNNENVADVAADEDGNEVVAAINNDENVADVDHRNNTDVSQELAQVDEVEEKRIKDMPCSGNDESIIKEAPSEVVGMMALSLSSAYAELRKFNA